MKKGILSLIVACVVLVSGFGTTKVFADTSGMDNEAEYQSATDLLSRGFTYEAQIKFKALGKYKDSAEMEMKTGLMIADTLRDGGHYYQAAEWYSKYSSVSTDAGSWASYCGYMIADDLLKKGYTYEAEELLGEIRNLVNSPKMMLECEAKNEVCLYDQFDDIDKDNMYASIVEHFLEEFRKEDIGLSDEDLIYKAKSCTMELIRHFALSGECDLVGKLSLAVLADEKFLTDYYGRSSTNNEYAAYHPVTKEYVYPCKAVQYWKNGGAELGKYYLTSEDDFDYITYRVTQNGEYYCFLSVLPDGTLVDGWSEELQIGRETILWSVREMFDVEAKNEFHLYDQFEDIDKDDMYASTVEHFEEAFRKNNTTMSDMKLTYKAKACTMEVIRQFALKGEYDKVGKMSLAVLSDGEFLEDYYSRDSINEKYSAVHPVTGKHYSPCKAVQYWKNGGAELGKYYLTSDTDYDYITYRVTEDGVFHCFLKFLPDGTFAERFPKQ